MKKLFTLIAALVCAVCVNAQEIKLGGNSWNITFPLKENVKITSKGGYAEYKLTGESFRAADYKGYRVEFSDITIPDGNSGIFQIKMISSETKDGTDYLGNPAQVPIIESYSGDISGNNGVVTGDFSVFTSEAPTVGGFYMQATSANISIVIKKAVLIKNDDTEVQLTFAGDTWGGSGFTAESLADGFPPILINGQYGGQQLLYSDGNAVTWSVSENKRYEFVIELLSPTGCSMMVEANDGGDKVYFNFEKGVSNLSFALDPNSISKDISEIWIKANDATASNYPAAFDVKSITLTKTDPTAISETLAPAKAENSVRYNLLGVKNGNGVYIMNGKKYIK